MVENTTQHVDSGSEEKFQVPSCDGWEKVRQLGKGNSSVVELMERYNAETGETE